MGSRILIADDTPTVLDFLELVFENQDFEVIRAGSGARALELARSQEPDLLLVDVMMPDMDGFEICRSLRRDPETTNQTILLYSAVVGEEVRARARAAGADEFLGKTLHHAELVSRVRDWLASRSLPGGVGDPAAVEVALDLLDLMQVELVWLLHKQQGLYRTAGISSARGQQQALRFQGLIGPGPFAPQAGSFFGRTEELRRLRMDWGLGEVADLVGGGTVANAMQRMGANALGSALLTTAEEEIGMVIFSSPAALAIDTARARAISAGLRYATMALAGLRGRGGRPEAPRRGPAIGA